MCIETDRLHASAFGYSSDVNEQQFPVNYVNAGIFPEAPYASVDQAGVGELMKLCVEEAKKAKPEIQIWGSGNNCSTKKSVDFCYSLGMKAVLCKAGMVPLARLCAAQAVLGMK
jgi:pyruvate,orthophosphate dikinase